MFEKKVVVITGGAQGIGAALCRAFAERGAHVCTIDVLPNPYFVGMWAGRRICAVLPKRYWQSMAMWIS